jgi:hypothetical protein
MILIKSRHWTGLFQKDGRGRLYEVVIFLSMITPEAGNHGAETAVSLKGPENPSLQEKI